jgi:hypothetical protein
LFSLPGLLDEGLWFGFGGAGGGVIDDGDIFVGQFVFTYITDPSGHFLVVSKGVCCSGHDGSEGFALQSMGAVTLFFSDDEPTLARLLELDELVELVPVGAGHVPLEV